MNKAYRNYLRAFHMFNTAYHMIQVYIMNKADNSGPEACLDDMDLVSYMIDVKDDLENIVNSYCDDIQPDDVIFDHCLYKLNGVRGMIEKESYLDSCGLFAKIQTTAAAVIAYYVK